MPLHLEGTSRVYSEHVDFVNNSVSTRRILEVINSIEPLEHRRSGSYTRGWAHTLAWIKQSLDHLLLSKEAPSKDVCRRLTYAVTV